jgi:hypothetical protein
LAFSVAGLRRSEEKEEGLKVDGIASREEILLLEVVTALPFVYFAQKVHICSSKTEDSPFSLSSMKSTTSLP